MSHLPLLDTLVRRRYLLIGAIAAAMVVGGSLHVTIDTDWQFFTWGSDLLFGQHHAFVREAYRIDPVLPGGLHLYANYSLLQIGPPALLLAKLLQIGPREGLYVAGAAVQLLGLGYVYAIDRAFRPRSPASTRLAVLLGGSMVIVVWGSLSQFRHLDDALALAALGGAVLALSRDRPWAAGALLGIAAASKPWAVPVLALVLVPRGRDTIKAASAAVVVAAGCWAPFVIANTDTMLLGQVTLQLSPASAVAALGIDRLPDPQTLRLLQFGLGAAVAVFLVLRGHAALAPLAAFSTRLVFEPSAYPYYGAGIVAAALLADLGETHTRGIPVLTAVATVGWLITEAGTPEAAGMTRLALYCGLVATTLVIARRSRDRGSNDAEGLFA